MAAAWIQTFMGKQFFPLEPREEDVDIRDIAHALSLNCRFSGHCRRFYSVAQHSVYMYRFATARGVSPAQALLHDASEAYMCDLPRPLKREMPEYMVAERNVQRVIFNRFGVNPDMTDALHHLDNDMLLTEKRDIMGREPAAWSVVGETLKDFHIGEWSPSIAENEFLTAFSFLAKLGEIKA